MQEYAIQDEQTLFDDFLKVKQASIRLTGEEGEETTIRRLSVEGKDAVAVLVHDCDRDELLFVRQFRYPTVRHGVPFPLEIPAGEVDLGETPDLAGKREIKEELGITVDTLVPIAKFFGSCGRLSELVHVYYAPVNGLGAVGNKGGLDADEAIEIVRMPLMRALEMLQNPQSLDGKLLVALQWYKLNNECAVEPTGAESFSPGQP